MNKLNLKSYGLTNERKVKGHRSSAERPPLII